MGCDLSLFLLTATAIAPRTAVGLNCVERVKEPVFTIRSCTCCLDSIDPSLVNRDGVEQCLASCQLPLGAGPSL